MNDRVAEILEEANKIHLNPVFSSNIKGIGYSNQTKLMVVMFNGGSKYLYENVDIPTYMTILNAPSVGKALNECIIKNKEKYKYYKLNSGGKDNGQISKGSEISS